MSGGTGFEVAFQVDVHMLRVYLGLRGIKGDEVLSLAHHQNRNWGLSLAMCKRLDIKPQCWAYPHDILAIQLLENRGFPCIVETTAKGVNIMLMVIVGAYRKRIRISFSFCRFFRIIVRRPMIIGVEGTFVVDGCGQRMVQAT